jgi:hypothetical protein
MDGMVMLDPKTPARRAKLGRRHPQNLVLGTAQWGAAYGIANRTGRPPLEEIAAMLEMARRAGIETLDTARAYGTSEAAIGALTEGESPFSVVTKLDPDVVEAGKPIFVRSIYLQGVAHLACADLPAHLAELAKPLEAVDTWAGERGLRRPEVFLLYARELLDAKILIGCETLGQLCQNLIAWRSLDAPRADLEELTASIPDLPDSLLDPSQWSSG